MQPSLVLGTAQFGSDYGVVNSRGRLALDDIRSILDVARLGGIETIDTAVGYGDAEQRLGLCGVAGFRVITKISPANIEPGAAGSAIRRMASECCERLRCSRLH